MVGNRRRSRESALQLLYQDEFHVPASRRVAERYFWKESEEAVTRLGLEDFAQFLVEGVRTHLAEIDERIRTVARNWKIERMSRVDRNILRMATFELLHATDIPPKVTLNEAIEIAKTYGTEDSSAFINGILDRISRDLQKPTGPTPPEEAAPPEPREAGAPPEGSEGGASTEVGEGEAAPERREGVPE